VLGSTERSCLPPAIGGPLALRATSDPAFPLSILSHDHRMSDATGDEEASQSPAHLTVTAAQALPIAGHWQRAHTQNPQDALGSGL
jgi:hypothetical protein